MISPELLRRYPFFGKLQAAQLNTLAMLAEEIELAAGTIIFAEGQPADWLLLLVEGSIDLSAKSEEEYHPKSRKVYSVGSINPGEVFGISAMVQPNLYNATATTEQPSRIIRFEGKALQDLVHADLDLGYELMYQIAKTALERLAYTRIQLAAAWA